MRIESVMIWQAAGTVIIAVILYDVFRTIFHAQGRGGPLNRRMNRLIWRVARRVAPAGREDALAFVGPFLICATLFLWVITLLGGFALIYYPVVETFLVSPGSLRAHWLEALYFSAYTGATLGFGDLVPDTAGMRLLAPVQALIGFALVSVSVTYLLSVYRELLLMRSLAGDIDSFLTANEVHGADDLARLPGFSVELWARDIDRQLGSTLEAHFLYPLIHYFRATSDDSALPVQIGRLWDRVGDESDATGPAVRSLRHTVQQYLESVDRHFVPADRSAPGASTPRDALRRILRYMRYHDA